MSEEATGFSVKPIGYVSCLRKTPEDEPVMQEFLPREAVTQPAWSHELMRDYWKPSPDLR